MRFRKGTRIRESNTFELGDGLSLDFAGDFGIPRLTASFSDLPTIFVSGSPYPGRVLSGDYPVLLVDNGAGNTLEITLDYSSANHLDVLTYNAFSGHAVWMSGGGGGGATDPLILSDSGTYGATAGQVTVYGDTLANGPVVPWAQPDLGHAFPLQASAGRRNVVWMTPANNTISSGAVGMGGGTIDGTSNYITGATPTESTAPDNSYLPLSYMQRVEVSQSTANSGAGWRAAENIWMRGASGSTNIPLGGFYHYYRFALKAMPSNARLRVGPFVPALALTSDPGANANPALGCLIKDSGDTNFSLWIKESSGTSAKVNLGVAVPVPSAGVDEGTYIYEWEVFVAPQGTTLYYRLTDFLTKTVLAEGSNDCSFVNGNSRFRFYAEAGTGSSGAVAFALLRVYGEREA